MPYTIPQNAGSDVIEQEFDLLDWKIRAGHLDQVRDRCTQILTSPTTSQMRSSWAHILMGTIELLSTNYEGALRNFQAAEPAPQLLRPRASAGAAKALTMLGRTEEAHTSVQHLISASPDSWYSWEALGVWQRQQGDKEGAWNSLVKASSMNPVDPSLISSLVVLGLELSRHSELSVALDAHLAFEPLNLGFRGCLVNCFLHTGDLERACEQAERIVSFAPFSVVPEELVSAMKELLSRLVRT